MDQVKAASTSVRLSAEVRKPAGRFDLVSISLHWLTVLLILCQFTTAWSIGYLSDNAATILAAHRSLGVIIGTVVIGRLMWRKTQATLPPFPPSMPPWQRRAATANEHALYALLLLQPLTGLGNTIFTGHPFQLGPWQIPSLMAPDRPVFRTLRIAHELGAWVLLAFVGLHAAAGLFHALVRRDGVFQRMTP